MNSARDVRYWPIADVVPDLGVMTLQVCPAGKYCLGFVTSAQYDRAEMR
jgi:hypothetical protein